jgi:hypothetical protein
LDCSALPQTALVEARSRLRSVLEARFGAPEAQELPADLRQELAGMEFKHGPSYMWDKIPPTFESSFPELWRALQATPGPVTLIFEEEAVSAFRTDGSILIGKVLSPTDLYLFPDAFSWIFVLTHEDAYGPYLVRLDA